MKNLYSPRSKPGDVLTVTNQTGATKQVRVIETHPPMFATVVKHDPKTGARADQARDMAKGWVKVEVIDGK